MSFATTSKGIPLFLLSLNNYLKLKYWYNWLIIAIVCLSATQAIAHDWYSYSCCSSHDCHPIASCSELQYNSDGSITWNKFTFSKEQVHPSQDSQCHVCIHDYVSYPVGQPMPMCVYIQQGS